MLEPVASQLCATKTRLSDRFEASFSPCTNSSLPFAYLFSAIQNDKGLVATSKAAHHAISALFDKPYDPVTEGGLVVQYEVKLQNGLECGGAYMKLLTESPEVRCELHVRRPAGWPSYRRVRIDAFS